ncbi:MAG: oligoendopeptidase F [candidate division Zixibacteria bacterium]|nr:oligoendopeptidase F [candidate division Zixibacteria bacterium]
MTSQTKKSPAAIPTRVDIETKHKWNLADLYTTDEAWEEDFKKAQALMAKAGQFSGKLAESPGLLYDCLKTRTELSLITSNLYQYAHLSRDLDNRVSRYQAMVDRAAMLSSEAGAAFAFVEPELLKIDEAHLREMAAEFERTDEYDFYIKELIRSRPHIRSEEVEELLAQSAVVARGPDSIFTMLNDADLKYPTIRDEDDNEVTLTKQRFAKFMESGDRRVRKDAHVGFYSIYKEHLNTLGASLASSVNADIFYSRARRFDSCLHTALDGDNIPTTVYHSLLDTTEANLSHLHEYTSLRKRLLGLDEIRPYDLICPLFPDRDYEVPYDKAVAEVLAALQPLGEEYCARLKEAFQSRWVDVYETEGKGSGAYSWGNYSSHPFVLMNYNNTVDNMFTLAHEMGHAMHSFHSNSNQPYTKSQYSTFVAEVASTLNEGLLIHYLLKKAADKQDKLYLLNRYIDNTMGTFFNQVMYARFELQIHKQIEKGGALSPDMLSKLWGELTQKYFGPDLALEEYAPLKWSRVPHFYMTFYVYQYATSYAASQTILDMIMKGEQGIIGRYLELLSAGGSDHPIELLKKCGVDMSTPSPVEANIRLFGEQVTDMDRLTA